MAYDAGAGRGKMGGPTAKELADYEAKQNEGIFTAEKIKKGQEAPRDLMPDDFKKRVAPPKKYAGGGGVSGYEGYMPSFAEEPEALRRAQARGIARMVDADYSGMKTGYGAYRQKGDPSPQEMVNRLRGADESAVKLLKRRQEDERQERVREDKRADRMRKEPRGAGAGRGFVNPPFTPADEEYKHGGKVKGYAKGGSIDGCAQRGKTKGRYL